MKKMFTELEMEDLREIDGGVLPILVGIVWGVVAGGGAAFAYWNYKTKG